VSPNSQIELLQADARYYRDRAALLRAKLYRWGLGSNDRLKEFERRAESAEQRLREHRLRESQGRDLTSSDRASQTP
jgi:hypothetical protein